MTFERFGNSNIISGYSSAELLETIIQKNKNRQIKLEADGAITSGEFQVAALINNIYQGKPLTVIDFGGGAGSHFYIFEKLYPGRIANWIVVETPKMVDICRREILHPNLSFVSDLKRIDVAKNQPDLVFSSSALQYTEDPLSSLGKLLDLDALSFIVTRTPLTETINQSIGTQKSSLSSNGPGPLPDGMQDLTVFYPIIIPTKESLEATISKKYQIKLTIYEGRTNFQNVGNFNCFTYLAVYKKSL